MLCSELGNSQDVLNAAKSIREQGPHSHVSSAALHLTYPKDKRKALALQQQLASRHQDDPAVAETESPRLPLRDPTTVYSADVDA